MKKQFEVATRRAMKIMDDPRKLYTFLADEEDRGVEDFLGGSYFMGDTPTDGLKMRSVPGNTFGNGPGRETHYILEILYQEAQGIVEFTLDRVITKRCRDPRGVMLRFGAWIFKNQLERILTICEEKHYVVKTTEPMLNDHQQPYGVVYILEEVSWENDNAIPKNELDWGLQQLTGPNTLWSQVSYRILEKTPQES